VKTVPFLPVQHGMIHLIIILVIVGVLVYLLNVLVPIDPKFKLVINAVIGIALFLYVLSVFGFVDARDMPRVR
jgi:hypothetical protein